MSAEIHNGEPFPEDATAVETDRVLLGNRSAGLLALTVSFDANAPDGAWNHLVEKMGLTFERATTGRAASFVALPLHLKPLRPYLLGGLLLDPQRPDMAFWTFTWARSPQTPPPQDMHAESAKVGGFPAVLQRLGALWPTNQPVDAEVSASYTLAFSEWRFRFSNMRNKRIRTEGGGFRIKPTRWEVEPPSGPVQEVLKESASAAIFKLTGRGRYPLHWTPRFLNEIDGAIWGGLEKLLERR